MKFEEIQYKRPDFNAFEKKVEHLLSEFNNTDAFLKQSQIIEKINQLRNEVLTMAMLCQIRHMKNTSDEHYNLEMNYINKHWPHYELAVSKYYDALIKSPFLEDIKSKYGNHLVNIAAISVNKVRSNVLEDLAYENKLVSDYNQLMSQSKIEVLGKECNISSINALMSSSDREIRKIASDKKYELMSKNCDSIDQILDNLIKVRTKIAKTLGFKSFVELGYLRLPRIGHHEEDIKTFSKNVEKYIVPLSLKLREEQKIRLSLEVLTYYDEDIRYLTGNPTPKGDASWIINQLKDIFSQPSNESKTFYDFITKYDLIDILPNNHKSLGAFTTFLSDYQSPYIFMNYNETYTSFKTLIHELGHAFQMYIYDNPHNIPEYILPTTEACELNAIGMEVMLWPFIDLIFKEDAGQYRFSHLEDLILYIPYRVCIDEFEHFLYEHPTATIIERKEKWLELEKKYQPLNSHLGNSYLEKGNFWQIQSHIFKLPFYYIDYAIAQICALQIWYLSQSDFNKAWKVYQDYSKMGGSVSFKELLEQSNISSPFDESSFKNLSRDLMEWFNDHK